MPPSVSVLLPVFNGLPWIQESVASLLNQSFSDIEIICVDDGSCDGTCEILQDYAGHDSRIRVLQYAHAGLVPALNAGLAAARGQLVARMDADDVAHPDRLALQVQAFAASPELVALGTGWDCIDAQGHFLRRCIPAIGHDNVMREQLWKTAILHPSVMMRKEAVISVGGYRRKCLHAEDYDLWFRLSEVGKLDNLKEPLLLYRQHANSVSRQEPLTQRNSMLLAQVSHYCRMEGVAEPDDSFSFPSFRHTRPLRADIAARMLQVRADWLGDERECPENGDLLAFIAGFPRNGTIRQGLCLYYLKCAMKYRRNPVKSLTYMVKGIAASPACALRQCYSYAVRRQLCL